jgi:hypothetical protein
MASGEAPFASPDAISVLLIKKVFCSIDPISDYRTLTIFFTKRVFP